MKKRALALLLAATMAVGVTACGGGNSGNNAGTDNAAADSAADNAAEDSADNAAADNTDDGAGQAEAPAGAAGEKILSVQIGPDPETIDPALNSAVDGGNMLLHSFECL